MAQVHEESFGFLRKRCYVKEKCVLKGKLSLIRLFERMSVFSRETDTSFEKNVVLGFSIFSRDTNPSCLLSRFLDLWPPGLCKLCGVVLSATRLMRLARWLQKYGELSSCIDGFR